MVLLVGEAERGLLVNNLWKTGGTWNSNSYYSYKRTLRAEKVRNFHSVEGTEKGEGRETRGRVEVAETGATRGTRTGHEAMARTVMAGEDRDDEDRGEKTGWTRWIDDQSLQ